MKIRSGLIAMSLVIAASSVTAAEVNVYSARQEALIKPLLDRFSSETGITVNLLTGKDDALLQRLTSEGANTPADLLLTVDVGRLHRAKEDGLLQSVNSDLINKAVPAYLRDRDNQWVGLSMRARPIMYAADRVKPEELSSYEGLTDPKWKGRICIRSSENVYNQSMTASMIATKGEAETKAWLEGFIKNFAREPQGGDRDQIMAAASGVCDIAIANTYYLGQMLQGKDPEQKALAEKIRIFWPNQEDRGTHINVSGAGITKAAKRPAEAQKLLEFLVSDESQNWYASTNNEYPMRAELAVSPLLKSWGEFKADSVNLTELGTNNKKAVILMDQVGWK